MVNESPVLIIIIYSIKFDCIQLFHLLVFYLIIILMKNKKL